MKRMIVLGGLLMIILPSVGEEYRISGGTPECDDLGYLLMDAVENTMRLRGERNTGWAMAWKLCLWARAGQPEQAYTLLESALKHAITYNVSTDPKNSGVYYNLLDAHPPFQIDGNFGLCAGITEMLMQSYGATLCPLAALPASWQEGGTVSGLQAEGGFLVDVEWNADVSRCTIRSRFSQPCTIRRRGLPAHHLLTDAEGRRLTPDIIDDQTLTFAAVPGEVYYLTFATNPDDTPALDTASLQIHIPASDDAPYYNLSGHRLPHPQRGINIRGGRKVVVK